MRNQRIEAGVFRYHIKVRAYGCGGESADVISDVEVDGVFSASTRLDIFDVGSKRLERACDCNWDFALVGAKEDHDLVRTPA